MVGKKRKRGGQPKPASERKRNNLTIRVLDRMRGALEEAAAASGRSVSEETQHRLMLSFMLESEMKTAEAMRHSALELQDVAEIRKQTDERLKEVMVTRGWGEVIDPRYGGTIFVPPGQMAAAFPEEVKKAVETMLAHNRGQRSEGGRE